LISTDFTRLLDSAHPGDHFETIYDAVLGEKGSPKDPNLPHHPHEFTWRLIILAFHTGMTVYWVHARWLRPESCNLWNICLQDEFRDIYGIPLIYKSAFRK